jgi:hypothetical protein
MIQLDLQDKLRDDLQIYYERQENAFDQLSTEDLEEYGIREESRAVLNAEADAGRSYHRRQHQPSVGDAARL